MRTFREMAAKGKASLRELSNEGLAERLQSILINTAEGRRSVADDREYASLRQELNRRRLPTTPHSVSVHPTLDSFSAFIKGVSHRERVALVRAEFELLFKTLEGSSDGSIDSEAWTGPTRPVERLRAAQALLPLAQVAVESMIMTLSEPNPNGAPLLEEREEALRHLRELHRALGELLAAVDAGQFEDELGQGLAAEAARYAKRVARALRDDPMPYLSSALLLGIFEACGLPGIAGYLVGVAQNVKKHGEKSGR